MKYLFGQRYTDHLTYKIEPFQLEGENRAEGIVVSFSWSELDSLSQYLGLDEYRGQERVSHYMIHSIEFELPFLKGMLFRSNVDEFGEHWIYRFSGWKQINNNSIVIK